MRTIIACLLALTSSIAAAEPPWAGSWITSRGLLTLTVSDNRATGTYGDDGATVDATIKGKSLRGSFRAGETSGRFQFDLQKGSTSFSGTWTNANGGSGSWDGWRDDPAARKGRAAKFGGVWRTSWGMLEIEQTGEKVSGRLGGQGFYKVKGTIEGRRMELEYSSPWGPGTLWMITRDGADSAFGAAVNQRGKSKFIARRLEDHMAPPKPRPGKIVHGLSKNLLTYHLSVPRGWSKRKAAPAIVFFHGSNMSSEPYTQTLSKWFGDRFVVIGIDGERWQDWSKPDDPRHNYSYVNWMGRSTYEGYPNTNRESPALVAETIEELKERLNLSKVLVGGHSQGAYLSYFMLTHFPDLVDGVFPVAGGVVIQCEPDVFDDDKLKQAQRATPLAVVHGRRDAAVAFSQGQYSFERFADHGYPAARFFDNDAPHAFIALRVKEAIEWLHALSSNDPTELIDFAEARLEHDAFRDVTAAILRLRTLEPNKKVQKRMDAAMAAVDEYASFDTERFLKAMEGEDGAEWIDEFLEFRSKFEFADVAAPAMKKFAELRAAQEPEAKKLLANARSAFNSGNRSMGWGLYEELVQSCYASSAYRRIKRSLAKR